jgi:hypothetical protein
MCAVALARPSPALALSHANLNRAILRDTSQFTDTTWGDAEEIPGTGTLNAGGDAQIYSLSCSSAGNCAAGGFYDGTRSGSYDYQAFVVNETSGSWGNAQEVPGTATLNSGGFAYLLSVSCVSAGYCAAGGFYEDGSGHFQGFVVNETNGTWQDAEEVPGMATLSAGGSAGIESVSCTSPGNCAAGGSYTAGPGGPSEAFVVNETSGMWGDAQEVLGMATLNVGGAAKVASVSCVSFRNCTAGGWYEDGSGHTQVFVVSEASGKWRVAKEVPGTATLNAGGLAELDSVSCASAGDCAAGGLYEDGSGDFEAFVASETKGKWGDAEEVPGSAPLNTGTAAGTNSVSCASAGNCAAAGYYQVAFGPTESFVVSETSGTWRDAEEVPGMATLNAGGSSVIFSVSCGSAGNCAAGGTYTQPGAGGTEAFVENETSGTWQNAEEVPGMATLNAGGDAQISSMSCAHAGSCAAGGSYRDSPNAFFQVFVVDSFAAPSISSFRPSSGPSGTVVVVKGKNLERAISVTFNGIVAIQIKKDISTEIKVVVPAGATTGPMAVRTSGGTANSSSNFTVT